MIKSIGGWIAVAGLLVAVPNDTASAADAVTAEAIYDVTGVRGGLVVHLGCGDGRLTAALAKGDEYLVHGLDTDVARVTDTICLLVGFRGQTHDTIRRDIGILRGQFKYGCINLLIENTRSADLIDREVKAWFAQEYRFLDDLPNIEVLWKNTDFGVG